MTKFRMLVWFIVAGVLALAGIVWFVVRPLGLHTKIANLERNAGTAISSLDGRMAAAPPATEEQIKEWEDLYAQMKQRYEHEKTFFEEFDTAWESWLAPAAAQDPNVFASLYHRTGSDRASPESMQSVLSEAQVRLGYMDQSESGGFAWENVTQDEVKAALQDPGIRATVQKRYWVRRRIFNTILGGPNRSNDLGVERLLEVGFYGRTGNMAIDTPRTVPPGMANPPRLDFPGGFLANIGTTAVQTQEPFVVRDWKLARTFTFHVAVTLPVENIPRFLARLQDPNLEPKMLVTVIAWRMAAYAENLSERKVQGPRDQIERMVREEEEKVKPQPVLLLVTAQVLDFIPENEEAMRRKLQEQAQQAAAPAAPSGG